MVQGLVMGAKLKLVRKEVLWLRNRFSSLPLDTCCLSCGGASRKNGWLCEPSQKSSPLRKVALETPAQSRKERKLENLAFQQWGVDDVSVTHTNQKGNPSSQRAPTLVSSTAETIGKNSLQCT